MTKLSEESRVQPNQYLCSCTKGRKNTIENSRLLFSHHYIRDVRMTCVRYFGGLPDKWGVRAFSHKLVYIDTTCREIAIEK